MPIGTAIVDWQGVVPMLLKADGSPYAGVTYVRNYVPGHQKKFPEITLYADNRQGFALMGNSQGYIPSFTIECWSVGARQGVRNDIANPENEGKFMLEVPDLEGGGIERHLVRFFEADFSRIYPRRAGFIEVFSADIENIEVLD
jgi:hypothetical protein